MLNRELDLKEAVEKVTGVLEHALTGHGRASLVVCGGSSPLGLFDGLSRQSLAWDRVAVLLADERDMNGSDDGGGDGVHTNARLVKERLLVREARVAKFVSYASLAALGAVPDDAPRAVADGLASFTPFMPFSAVILGFGGDGHFASLFPGDPQLAHHLDLSTPPGLLYTGKAMGTPACPRWSMNLSLLVRTDFLGLLIGSPAKRAVFTRAQEPSSDPLELPLTALLRQEQVSVHPIGSSLL